MLRETVINIPELRVFTKEVFITILISTSKIIYATKNDRIIRVTLWRCGTSQGASND